MKLSVNFDYPALTIEELEYRMQAGILSQKGFLGKNEKLNEVLASDAKTLKKIKVTCKEIAEQLEVLIIAALEHSNHNATVGNFKVSLTVFPGFQICPWSPDILKSQCTKGKGVQFGSIDWCIKNLLSKRKICGSGLMIHLIRDHQFFEGFESSYRVDPMEIAEILNLIKIEKPYRKL